MAFLIAVVGCKSNDEEPTNSPQGAMVADPAQVLEYDGECNGTPTGCERFYYTYDSAGRMLTRSRDKCVGGKTLCTKNVFDSAGRILSREEHCDGKLGCFTWEYDDTGRLVREVQAMTCEYLANGMGICTEYAYSGPTMRTGKPCQGASGACWIDVLDAAGRILSRSVDEACDGTSACVWETHQYDSAGRELEDNQNECSTLYHATCKRFEYDSTGKLVKVDFDDNNACDGAHAPSSCYSYSYDALGRLQQIAGNDCSGTINHCTAYAYEQSETSPACQWESCECKGANATVCDFCRQACAAGKNGPCPALSSDCMAVCVGGQCQDGKFSIVSNDGTVCLEIPCQY